MRNLRIENKTELREMILLSEKTTLSLKYIHFFVKENKITWEIEDACGNYNSSADGIVNIGMMDCTRESFIKKERNIAISYSFKQIENGNYDIV